MKLRKIICVNFLDGWHKVFTYIVEWWCEGTCEDVWREKNWDDVKDRIKSQLMKQPNWTAKIILNVWAN